MDTATPADQRIEIAPMIRRNVLIGLIAMLAITTGIALLAGTDPMQAVGIAAVPAVFAGPFLGGLFTMVQVHNHEGADGSA